MHDATNDAPIIRPLNTSHICRQMGFNPIPLLIAQPKEVRPHDPDPPKRIRSPWNQDSLVPAATLMSLDPSRGDEYRRLARECLRLAHASASESRRVLLKWLKSGRDWRMNKMLHLDKNYCSDNASEPKTTTWSTAEVLKRRIEASRSV
jgi:hypothetical protein